MKPVLRSPLFMRFSLLLMLTSTSPQALAEMDQENLRPESPETQSATKAWLELQSSGRAASEQAQPLTGPAMDRVHERYLKNFSHPIPPSYEHADRISN